MTRLCSWQGYKAFHPPQDTLYYVSAGLPPSIKFVTFSCMELARKLHWSSRTATPRGPYQYVSSHPISEATMISTSVTLNGHNDTIQTNLAQLCRFFPRKPRGSSHIRVCLALIHQAGKCLSRLSAFSTFHLGHLCKPRPVFCTRKKV